MATLEPAWPQLSHSSGKWLLFCRRCHCWLLQAAASINSDPRVLRLNPEYIPAFCSVFLWPGHSCVVTVARSVTPGVWECLSRETVLDCDVSFPASSPFLLSRASEVDFHVSVTRTQSGETTCVEPHSAGHRDPRYSPRSPILALLPPRLGEQLFLEESEPGAHSQSAYAEPRTSLKPLKSTLYLETTLSQDCVL